MSRSSGAFHQWKRQSAPRVLVDPPQRPLDLPDDPDRLPVVNLRTGYAPANVFRKRVGEISGSAGAGDLVRVLADTRQHLGFGHYNPAAEVALRMVSSGTAPPDDAFWTHRLEQAITLRRDLLKLDDVTDAQRLLHAEGDFLPGIVVDRYGDTLSAEAFSLAMFQRSQAVVERLAGLCGTKHWVIRTSPHSDRHEGFSAEPLKSPQLPRSVIVQEHGTRFRISFDEGHKTGFFCDQRDNRHRLASLCEGQSVADICCYTGGFAVQAKKLGRASEVIGVDLDEKALELAKSNANLNQVQVKWVHADAFAWMRDMQRNGRQFDVVVLDPPKLIHSRVEFEEGRRAHFDLNRLAMPLVKPGGLLVTFSCSGLLSREEFEQLVCAASRQAGEPLEAANSDGFSRRGPREMQIIDRSGAGPDHPTAANCPESDYLKAIWLRLL